MERSEMEEYLDRLGWSKTDLSRRIGVDRVTVSRWRVVPGPVEAYLKLYDRVVGCLDL
jgi:DNA-binding Xre family transcriptional regulator